MAQHATYFEPEYVRSFENIMTNQQFWIGALIGVAVLFIDSFRRYDQFESDSPLQAEFQHAPPSLLTTPLVYHQSLIVYYLLRVAAFAVPAILFPVMLMYNPDFLDGVFGDFLVDETRFKEELYQFVTTPVFPVIWAFASAGFLSLLPYYVSVEPRLRRFAQAVAFIAQGVQRRLNMIHRSALAAPSEPVGDAAPDAFLREVEPQDARAEDFHALEQRWMRLAQIMRMLDPTNRSGVNSRFVEEHPEPFRRLTEEFFGLRIRVRYHRTLTDELGTAPNAEERLGLLDRLTKHDPELLRDVNKLLGQAEKTLAASLPTSTRLAGRSSQRLRSLGFKVEEVEEDMSFGLVFVAILMGCVAGFFGTLLTRALMIPIATLPGIEFSPRTSALSEASTMIFYFAAIFASVAIGALWLGARAAGLRPDVIHPRSYFQRPLGQYVFAGLIGAALSYVMLLATLAALSSVAQAVALAGLIAVFIPFLFATNFLVLFPIYRPSRNLASLLSESALLALAAAVASFITWTLFVDARNNIAIAQGQSSAIIPPAEMLGGAIYSALRTIFVNTAVFASIVYMAHQMRAARALDSERPAVFRPGAAVAPA